MKIHIVQKGESLFSIAEKYHVDFQQLVDLNTQLASPDMIMPGMKIRIPVTAKEKSATKNKQKLQLDQVPSKPIYSLAEDDYHQPRDFEIKKPELKQNKPLPVMAEMNDQKSMNTINPQAVNFLEQNDKYLYMPVYVPVYYPYYHPTEGMNCPFCGLREVNDDSQSSLEFMGNERKVEIAQEISPISVQAPPL